MQLSLLLLFSCLFISGTGLKQRVLPTVNVYLDPGPHGEDVNQKKALSEDLQKALHDVGAAFVRVHGGPPGFRQRTFEAARHVFSVSEEEKQSLKISKQGFIRGFVPLGGESGSKRREVKEAFSMGYTWGDMDEENPTNGLQGFNLWPKTFDSEDSNRQILQDLYSLFASTSKAFVRETLSQVPGLENLAGITDQGESISLLRLFHYFGNTSGEFRNMGCHEQEIECTGSSPHTDWGLLTLILIEDQEGLDSLHFSTPDDGWVKVRPGITDVLDSDTDCDHDDSLLFLVNVGDFLALTSDFLISSPLHRVALSTQDRYSFVFFAFPNFEASVPKYNASKGKVSLLTDQSQNGQSVPIANLTFGELIMYKWAQVQRSMPAKVDEPSLDNLVSSSEILLVKFVQILATSLALFCAITLLVREPYATVSSPH